MFYYENWVAAQILLISEQYVTCPLFDLLIIYRKEMMTVMPLQTSTWLLMSLPTFTKQGSQVLYLHTHPSDGQQTLYKCSFVTHIRHPKLHTLSLCTHLPLHSHCINPCLCAYAGAVLCFLPGWQDIKAVQQKLEETPSFRSGSQMILPCKRLVCVSSARLTDMR